MVKENVIRIYLEQLKNGEREPITIQSSIDEIVEDLVYFSNFYIDLQKIYQSNRGE